MNYDEQEKLIAQQRAKYLQQQDQQAPQGRMVGGRYVAANPLEYLAAGLRGYGGFKGEQQANQDLTDLQVKKQAAMQGDMNAIISALRDKPAETVQPLTPNDDEGNVNPPIQMPARSGSLQKAYEIAAGSQFPQFQQMGMQGALTTAQNEYNKNQELEQRLKYTNILKTAPTPQDALNAGVPHEMVKSYYESQNYGKNKGVVINGQLVDSMTGKPIGSPVEKQVDVASDLIIKDPVTGKWVPNEALIGAKSRIAAAGKSSTNNTVINAGPKAFDTELGKMDAEQLGKWRDAAQTAQSVLATVQNLRDAEKAGAYSGGGANTRLGIANMIEGWTGIAPKGLVGSQVYNAEASKLILDRVKALGANPSNADREFIEKTVPQLGQSAAARAQLTDWMEKQAGKSIGLYNRADSYAREKRGLGGFNIFEQGTPSAPTVPDAGAIAAEIERRKGRK
jgi:hypothetical protein